MKVNNKKRSPKQNINNNSKINKKIFIKQKLFPFQVVLKRKRKMMNNRLLQLTKNKLTFRSKSFQERWMMKILKRWNQDWLMIIEK